MAKEKTNPEQLKFEDLENANFQNIEEINLTTFDEEKKEEIETENEDNIFLIEEEPKPEPKKETRGRPRKPQATEGDKTTWGEEKQETFIQEDRPQNPSHLNASQLIPVEAVLIAFDKGMSILLPFAINALTGKKTFKSADFKLTAEEKKQLKEPLEKCMQELKINISNPWVILGIVGVSIYGGKAANVLENGSAEEPKKDGRGRPRKNG